MGLNETSLSPCKAVILGICSLQAKPRDQRLALAEYLTGEGETQQKKHISGGSGHQTCNTFLNSRHIKPSNNYRGQNGQVRTLGQSKSQTCCNNPGKELLRFQTKVVTLGIKKGPSAEVF